MKKRIATMAFLPFIMVLLLCGCSYQWQGMEAPSSGSILGNGEKTLKISSVDQATLYTWLPYFVRNAVRDEIQLRKLARFVDGSPPADYTMEIRVPSFQVRASSSDSEGVTLLTSASVQLELVVFQGQSNTVYWTSGPVVYQEIYEAAREPEALREVLTQAVFRAIDRMQLAF